MTTTRPLLWPLHDRLGINEVPIESSLYIQNGYPSGLPVPSGDHNGKLRRGGQWHQYLDLNTMRNEDYLDVSAMKVLQLSSTRLTYNVGENVLTTGATVLTRATYLIEGTRVETDTTFLNPIGGTINGDPLIYTTATVPGRIWVYSDASGNVRYESAAAAAADSPASDEQALVGIDVDALGVVTSGSVAPTAQPLPTSRSLAVTIPVDFTGAVTIKGSGEMLTVVGGQATGGAEAMSIDGGIGPALTVVSTSPTDAAVAITNNSGGAPLVVDGTATGGAVTVDGNTGLGIAVAVTGAFAGVAVTPSGAGAGVSVTATGSGIGIRASTAGGSGSAIVAIGPSGANVVSSSCDTGAAYRATVTSTGVGFSALGGPSATSIAVRGESSHVDAYAVQGITAAGAGATSAGVLGSGLGDGVGVYANGMAGNGYGLIAAADTSTPQRAAMRLIPQDADPVVGEQGARLMNSARGPTGKERIYTTQWESVHSSRLGWVKDWGVSAAGGPIAGGSGLLSIVQVTTEEVGTLLLTATGSLTFSVDNGNCTINLYDTNGGGADILIATQVERAIDTDAVAPNVRSFVIRASYVQPSTANDTYYVEIVANVGTITYTNVVCSVEGVQ